MGWASRLNKSNEKARIHNYQHPAKPSRAPKVEKLLTTEEKLASGVPTTPEELYILRKRLRRRAY